MPSDELFDDRHDELARLVAGRLRRLPVPQAPATLHRRVMTAVNATRPAVRPWSIWPRVWQTIFALGLATIAGSAVMAWSTIAANARGDAWWQVGIRAVAGTTDALSAVRGGFSVALSWFTALLAMPVTVALIALIAIAALAFLVLGAWLSRIALPPLAWSKGASR